MSNTTENSNRKKLVIIFAWFLIPLVAAFTWYKFLPENYRPTSTTNNGDILEGIFALEPFSQQTVDGKKYSNVDVEKVWTLVHMIQSDCDEACSQSLYNTRQMRISMGKDIKRLKRIAIVSALVDSPSNKKMWASHPDLRVLIATDKGVAAQIKSKITEVEIEQNSLFLIDPLGNVMMHFSSKLGPKLMKKDIRKLFKLSHIG